MRSLVLWSLVVTSIACSTQGSGAPSGSKGSSSEPPAPEPKRAAQDTGSDSAPPDDATQVAELVVKSVGSKALGSQVIDRACVGVVLVPAGDWTVAAARLKDCGDKTARSILWIYKRKSGPWNEDYAGQPPKCWKGVPPDIAPSLAIASKIPAC